MNWERLKKSSSQTVRPALALGQKPHQVAEPSSLKTVRGTAWAVKGRATIKAKPSNISERIFMVIILQAWNQLGTTPALKSLVQAGRTSIPTHTITDTEKKWGKN
jgi:hypothetical protein